ncbi:hypothetical protein [Dyadobacter sediminis]|uniref:Uncharacterized protein n=1 Tax=Dyadobacter sediminis TaxID=1493691 RepID=A0A5R9KFH8_9BACT|nr:hypothetical protein [Dyadobacter sediminis]TLU94808.1 hypothetical protein FEM55_11345 [Dyadobacter sediminis]
MKNAQHGTEYMRLRLCGKVPETVLERQKKQLHTEKRQSINKEGISQSSIQEILRHKIKIVTRINYKNKIPSGLFLTSMKALQLLNFNKYLQLKTDTHSITGIIQLNNPILHFY